MHPRNELSAANPPGKDLADPRPSGVSGALRAFTEQDAPGPAADHDSLAGYTLLVASDGPTRDQACRLAHRAYCRCGHFSSGDADDRYRLPQDTHPATLTLLARDRSGVPVATATLVYDDGGGLACEETFHPELDGLRRAGRRLAEVARLALDAEARPPRALLVRLFNVLYLHARALRGCSDLVAEVIPRHAGYYRLLLGFEPLGPGRRWPRGRDVTAHLLRLDLLQAERTILRARSAPTLMLYRHALTPAQEERILEVFRRSGSVLPLDTGESFSRQMALEHSGSDAGPRFSAPCSGAAPEAR